MLSYIDQNQNDQCNLLEEMILQSSHTADKDGVDKVGQILSKTLSECGMRVETVVEKNHGNHLIFRSEATNTCTIAPILFVGHMDTVFPPNSHFNWYKDDGEKIYGPGVIDMKGGLVVATFAIKALHASGLLAKIPITFICNSDEETGSLTSKQVIEQEALKSSLALVFECGGLQGEVVTGRKGKTGYSIQVHGKAGHAAFAGEEKASAILELAHKIPAIEYLNDPQKSLVVNVGVISGGVGPNTIADFAHAEIDTRFIRKEDGIRNEGLIRNIAENCSVFNTKTTLNITSARPPMEQSEGNVLLYNFIKQEAHELGIPILDELRSGVSDANTIASCNIPVVDGLGPVGDCDHSDKEYMIKSSLAEKTKLTIQSILSLWKALEMGTFNQEANLKN